jgi:hypothetical protein
LKYGDEEARGEPPKQMREGERSIAPKDRAPPTIVERAISNIFLDKNEKLDARNRRCVKSVAVTKKSLLTIAINAEFFADGFATSAMLSWVRSATTPTICGN